MIKQIAIVGLGSIGKRYLKLIRDSRPEIKITIVRSRKNRIVKEEKIADNIVYSLEHAVNKGIQAAIIATPAILHVDQALKLIKMGIHVLVEKPLSNSFTNIDELLLAKKKSDVVCLLGYCLRFDPAALEFNKMIKENKMGKPLHVDIDSGSYLPDWRPELDYKKSVSASKKLGGGVLLELSHELDYINWFFGDLKSLSAILLNSGTLNIDVEDSSEIIIHADQGYTISVHLDFNTRTNRRTCKIRSTKGDLIWDVNSKKITWITNNGKKEQKIFDHVKNDMYLFQLNHFFDCIESGKKPKVTFDDGISVLKTIKAIKESHSTGERVFL